MHNAHVVTYLRALYWSLEEQGRLWSMAFVGQWHDDELQLAQEATQCRSSN